MHVKSCPLSRAVCGFDDAEALVGVARVTSHGQGEVGKQWLCNVRYNPSFECIRHKETDATLNKVAFVRLAKRHTLFEKVS